MTILGNIGPLLKKAVPIGAAMKGVANADPRLKSFIYAATAAGYGADMVMDFLRDLSQKKDLTRQEARIQQRTEAGTARPDETARLQEEGLPDFLRKGVQLGAGALAGRAAAGQAGAGQAPQAPQQQDSRSFFKRALAGQEFFDLPDDQRRRIGPLGKRITTLERDGVPWEDKNVQKLATSIQNMMGGQGVVQQERERFQQQYSPQEQATPSGGEADAQLIAMLEQFSKQILGE